VLAVVFTNGTLNALAVADVVTLAVVAVVAVVAVAAFPPIDSPAAVPVMFVPTKADGVPNAGVTRVGLVANTADPVPVSFVSAVNSCKDVNDPRDVAFPTEVTAPVKLAFVVTLVAVKLVAVPVMFVPTSAEGVPSAGVTRVGLVERTLLPEPVEAVTPVPPFKTGTIVLSSKMRYQFIAVVPRISVDLKVVVHNAPPLTVPASTFTAPPAKSLETSASISRAHAAAATT
jgi:hypothetical protein